MNVLTILYKNIFSKICFTLILSALFITSCEEQIDDLWEADDESANTSPLVGDWYADSMNLHWSQCNMDSSTSFMMINNIDSYNLWLLSDGSFQLALSQTANVENVCVDEHDGTWDPVDGCGGGYDYYDYVYFNETPLQFCNNRIGYNEYNIETSDCSQNISLEGTWQSDEVASSITLTTDPHCSNSSNPWGMASYQGTSTSCENVGNVWKTSVVKTYSYSIDKTTGELNLNLDNGDDTCLKSYLTLE